MSAKPYALKPADRPPALSVVGTQVTVLADRRDTQDPQITVQSGDEGRGPPPHSHPWAESFYVTRGQVLFTCGGQTTVCTAGTLVQVPADAVHAFSYGPGGGEMLEITAGSSQAIPMFTALDREVPPGPPDVAKIMQVAGGYRVRFHL